MMFLKKNNHERGYFFFSLTRFTYISFKQLEDLIVNYRKEVTQNG